MTAILNPLSIDAELAERLERDPEFRRRYIRKWAQVEVASGIRALRKRRRKRQGELAALANTGQSAISRIEAADYDGWTFKTLLTIAEALGARLRIAFEPLEDVVARQGGLFDATDVALIGTDDTSHGATHEAFDVAPPADFVDRDSTVHWLN